MTVLGVDPGLERIGYGAVRTAGSRVEVVEFGLIQTPRIEIGQRLKLAHEAAGEVLDRVRPDCVAVERLFFARNRTSAMDVAKALGVVLLAASQRGLECAEYTPAEVKLAVVGNGAADKAQVAYMVVKLLGLAEPPRPDDVADALAIAITHALRAKIPS